MRLQERNILFDNRRYYYNIGVELLIPYHFKNFLPSMIFHLLMDGRFQIAAMYVFFLNGHKSFYILFVTSRN